MLKLMTYINKNVKHWNIKSFDPQQVKTPPPSLRGLGDLVEKVTEKTGIKSLVEKVAGKDCGCNKRRDILNKLVPFRGEQ